IETLKIALIDLRSYLIRKEAFRVESIEHFTKLSCGVRLTRIVVAVSTRIGIAVVRASLTTPESRKFGIIASVIGFVRGIGRIAGINLLVIATPGLIPVIVLVPHDS